MHRRRARVLIVENAERTLSLAIEPILAHHEVDIAANCNEALVRIDAARRRYDLIFCDLVCGHVPGLDFWAYLALGRPHAAERVVFAASARVPTRMQTFLDRLQNPYVELPVDTEALDALASRRAAAR